MYQRRRFYYCYHELFNVRRAETFSHDEIIKRWHITKHCNVKAWVEKAKIAHRSFGYNCDLKARDVGGGKYVLIERYPHVEQQYRIIIYQKKGEEKREKHLHFHPRRHSAKTKTYEKRLMLVTKKVQSLYACVSSLHSHHSMSISRGREKSSGARE